MKFWQSGKCPHEDMWTSLFFFFLHSLASLAAMNAYDILPKIRISLWFFFPLQHTEQSSTTDEALARQRPITFNHFSGLCGFACMFVCTYATDTLEGSLDLMNLSFCIEKEWQIQRPNRQKDVNIFTSIFYQANPDVVIFSRWTLMRSIFVSGEPWCGQFFFQLNPDVVNFFFQLNPDVVNFSFSWTLKCSFFQVNHDVVNFSFRWTLMWSIFLSEEPWYVNFSFRCTLMWSIFLPDEPWCGQFFFPLNPDVVIFFRSPWCGKVSSSSSSGTSPHCTHVRALDHSMVNT